MVAKLPYSLILCLCFVSVSPQCYVKPTLVNPFSVSSLNEGQASMKQLGCFSCNCKGDDMIHYAIVLASVNPTYCRNCFQILNMTSSLPGSRPNFCLFFFPSVTTVRQSRGPVFEMTMNCIVENIATTTISTTVPTTQSTIPAATTVIVPVPTTSAGGVTVAATTIATGTTQAGASTVAASTGATTAAGSTASTATGGSSATTASTIVSSTDPSTTSVTPASTATTPAATTPTTMASTVTVSTDASTAATTPPTATSTVIGSTDASTAIGSTTAGTAVGSTTAGTVATSSVTTGVGSTVTVGVTTDTVATTVMTSTDPATTTAAVITTPVPFQQFLTASGTIQVLVIPNQQPFFNKSSVTVTKNAMSVNNGGIVYTVDFVDPEGDPVFFTLEVDPPNSNFYIDGAGNVRAVITLQSECSSASYTFRITATDNKHDPVGPHLATVHLTGTSTAPKATGLNKEFFYKEDVRVPTFITKWSVSSDTKKTTQKFKPSSARTLFRIIGSTIRISEKLNFEDYPKINITFTFSNDNCESEYYILINVGNVNDIPVLSPSTQTLSVNEGKVTVQPNYTITDADFNDRHTFSFFRDRHQGYNIDPATGAISHPTGVIIDKTVQQTVRLEVVVTDENGPAISEKVLVTLLLQDSNNHAPEIMVKSFTETAMSCDSPKRLPIALEVTDKDSTRNGNSDWSVLAVSSGPLTITPDGAVYQTALVVPGETYSIQAFVVDHGTPSLTSTVPVTVTLIGLPCTPPPPVGTAIATQAPNSNSGSGSGGTGTGTGTGGSSSGSSSSSSNSNSNSNSNSGGTDQQAVTQTTDTTDDTAAIVLGVLFGLLLLAGLTYLIWRYVMPRFCPGAYDSISYSCSNCTERCCPKKTNFVRPRGGQNNYDFWKEDYNEGTYRDTQHRSSRPAPFQYY